MFIQNKSIKDYIHKCNVERLPINYDGKMEVNLFDHRILVEKNEWLWHLHLKITDKCNAKCSFCVEQNAERCENAEYFIMQVDEMLSEMEKEGILYSVSVTGGEPLLFEKFTKLCEVLGKHDIKFLTINTNGKYLENHIKEIDGLFDFVDISRHAISDKKNNEIFGTCMPSLVDLERIKGKLLKTKMRLQCVLCDANTIEDVLNMIDAYSFADDLSFRKLMKLSEKSGIKYDEKEELYSKILEYAYNHFEFIEQTIQDYYVYEIWKYKDTLITFSYSNMKMLSEIEKTEDDSVCREFILHPDGTISGSWNKNMKVIKKQHIKFI